MPDDPATTVDELVAALSAQASRDASEPVDITLGGYAGKSITLEVPEGPDFTDCDRGYGRQLGLRRGRHDPVRLSQWPGRDRRPCTSSTSTV